MNDITGILMNIAQSMPGFLLAIVGHEAAHAYVAHRFGDSTAKDQGRISLNPVVHADPVGTILFPLIAVVTGFAMIGWARPVPVETRNFKEIRKGIFWVSFAGPLANIFMGTFAAFLMALIATQVSADWEFYGISLRMLRYAIFINFILAFFNLLPIPPLDGSKMLSSFLYGNTLRKYEDLARFTPMLFIGAMLLSFMGLHTIGYLLRPAQILSNYIMFGFLSLFGAVG